MKNIGNVYRRQYCYSELKYLYLFAILCDGIYNWMLHNVSPSPRMKCSVQLLNIPRKIYKIINAKLFHLMYFIPLFFLNVASPLQHILMQVLFNHPTFPLDCLFFLFSRCYLSAVYLIPRKRSIRLAGSLLISFVISLIECASINNAVFCLP